MNELGTSFSRIWQDDRLAIWITLALVITQAVVALRTYQKTHKHLRISRQDIRKLCTELRGNEDVDRVVTDPSDRSSEATSNDQTGGNETAEPRIAIEVVRSSKGLAGGRPRPIDMQQLYDPDSLLPAAYNARLDAAAPGLFTALGIIGTFIGLILAFLRVDVQPSGAANSVAPLIGGMVVAFFNSLFGVVLSLVWSYTSRISRHDFDTSCKDLQRAAQKKYQPCNVDDAASISFQAIEQHTASQAALLKSMNTLLKRFMVGARRGLKEINENAASHADLLTQTHRSIEGLAAVTKESSTNVLNELSPRLEEAFRSITQTPFDRLNTVAKEFERTIELAAEKQTALGARLQHVAEELKGAEALVAKAVDRAGTTTERFAAATSSLETAVNAVTSVAAEGRASAEAFLRASRDLQVLVGNLSAVNSALDASSQSLGKQAAWIGRAGETLERVADGLQSNLREQVQATVEVIRTRMDGLTGSIVDGYRSATTELVKAIDDRVSDLTDRLTSELSTLANRLPAEIQVLNEAMASVRQQIRQATGSLQEATSRLAETTPERLRAQLTEFDQALARAVTHFSGTLAQWDAHVEQIASLALVLENAADRQGHALPIPGVDLPSSEA